MIQESITGQTFSMLENLMEVYGRQIFEKTAAIFFGLFTTFYACRFIWIIAQKTTLGKGLAIEDLIKPIFISIFLGAVMTNPDFVYEWIVHPAKDLAVGLTTITASVTTGEDPANFGIVQMLDMVDESLNKVVFKRIDDIQDAIPIYQLYLHIGIWLIYGLYVFVWFLFLALIIESLFRFMTFFAISPLIVTTYFFEASKPIFIAGFRSLLHGVLSMFMAGVAMGMTMAVINKNGKLFFIPGTEEISSDWIFSSQYFTLVLIALISISFHLKAPKISANLANIDDGPGAAATVAGLGTAAVMTGKSMAVGAVSSGAKKASKWALGKAVKKASPHVRRGYEGFKDFLRDESNLHSRIT